MIDISLRTNMRLKLVGDGPLKNSLQSLVKRLAISNEVEWTGWVDKLQLRNLYQSADFVVNPSFFEGMPNVVLEAMASGLPVIASDVAGNNEVVSHGETGFLFSLKEPGLLVEYMQILATNNDLRRQMGQVARKRAQERYSWETVARQFVGLFN